MFQFTREFIINDNTGKLTGGKKFVWNSATETLLVDNMINIRKKDVNALYKRAHRDAKNEQMVVTATPVSGKLYRLVITLGLQGKVSATFNDQYPDHSRQFFYEYVSASTSEEDLWNGLLASFNHEKTISSEEFLTLSLNGSNKLVIDTPDPYTRIKEVRLVTLPVNYDTHVGAVLTGYEAYDVVFDIKRKDAVTAAASTAGLVSFRAGDEGMGTVVRILKNMRLLTAANIDPFGLNVDERPIPGGQYDQYTVELVTERRNIGHDVMGSVGTSLTTVVFFVEQGATSAFKTELENLAPVVDINPEADGSTWEHQPAPEVLAKAKDVTAVTEAVDDLTEDVDALGDIVPTPGEGDVGNVLTAGADGTASWEPTE